MSGRGNDRKGPSGLRRSDEGQVHADKPALVYHELRRVEIPPAKPGEFQILSAAVMSCGLCDKVISGMGGPGRGVICESCAGLLMSGRLRGAVRYD